MTRPATLAPDPVGATFPLWGGSATVLVADPAALAPALAAVRRTLDEVDRACSGYRDDSDLARLNAAAGRTVVVGTTLRRAVTVALDAAAWTDGLVDPTVGVATLPGSDPTAWIGGLRDVPVSPWRRVELDPVLGSVRIPTGTAIDLGATAKAWAADVAAERARVAAGGSGVLVSLAGDIATAGPAPAGGWAIRVTDDHRTDPTDRDRPGVTVRIDGGGLATSSTTVRRRPTAGGTTVAHVVDPRTWAPVESPWRTVTVAADDCTTANSASTAALVLGPGAPSWLAGRALDARLVTTDGRVVTVGDWPPDPDGTGLPDRTLIEIDDTTTEGATR